MRAGPENLVTQENLDLSALKSALSCKRCPARRPRVCMVAAKKGSKHQKHSQQDQPQQTKQPNASAVEAIRQVKISAKQGLQLQEVLDLDIFSVDGALTPDECKAFIAAGESAGFAHQSSRGPRFGEALRDNGRLQVNDEALAQRLWQATGLQGLFEHLALGSARAVGLNPNLRFYKYVPGQHFGRHIDESVEALPGRWTQFTLLIYLSGGLAGGETVFYGPRGRKVASVEPAPGRALLHLHGDQCLEHEALPVRRGTKYILRSDVVFDG